MTRIVLTDNGAKVKAFFKFRGMDFDSFLRTSVDLMQEAVKEVPVQGAPDTHLIEVDDEFVQACLDRNFEPGTILSAFLTEVMDSLKTSEAVAQAGVPSADVPLDLKVEG